MKVPIDAISGGKLPIQPEDYAMAFSGNEEWDKKTRCIEHLRADFGQQGKEFCTSFFDHCRELKTDKFKRELGQLIKELRGSYLKDYATMSAACHAMPEARIPATYRSEPEYIVKYESAFYRYILRLIPHVGDYNLYLYCYEKENYHMAKKCDNCAMNGITSSSKIEHGKETEELTYTFSLYIAEFEMDGDFPVTAASLREAEGKASDIIMDVLKQMPGSIGIGYSVSMTGNNALEVLSNSLSKLDRNIPVVVFKDDEKDTLCLLRNPSDGSMRLPVSGFIDANSVDEDDLEAWCQEHNIEVLE